MKRQGIPICLYYLFIYRPFSICGISSDVIFSHPFVSVVFSLFFLEKSDKSFISFIDIHQHLFSLTFSPLFFGFSFISAPIFIILFPLPVLSLISSFSSFLRWEQRLLT